MICTICKLDTLELSLLDVLYTDDKLTMGSHVNYVKERNIFQLIIAQVPYILCEKCNNPVKAIVNDTMISIDGANFFEPIAVLEFKSRPYLFCPRIDFAEFENFGTAIVDSGNGVLFIPNKNIHRVGPNCIYVDGELMIVYRDRVTDAVTIINTNGETVSFVTVPIIKEYGFPKIYESAINNVRFVIDQKINSFINIAKPKIKSARL